MHFSHKLKTYSLEGTLNILINIPLRVVIAFSCALRFIAASMQIIIKQH